MDTRRKQTRQLRIFHGRVNVGGIGRRLADWQRRRGAVADVITYHLNPYFPTDDLCLRVKEYRRPARWVLAASTFVFSVIKYDLFNFYFGRTFLPAGLDLPILKLLGKKIVMIYCGSDIRLLSVEEKRNPYHRLIRGGENWPRKDRTKRLMMWWHGLWIDRFLVVRNLIVYARECLPEHKIVTDLWVQNAMDMTAYRPVFFTHRVPVLVHAPTCPQIKGTEYVERAIEELRRDGYPFEYVRIEGMLNVEAQRIYRDRADIIIDQLLVGGFGILAVEGMYYGKPVCCYVLDEIAAMYPDCPIVNCTIETLKEKLARLIDNPSERVALGRAGRAFVEKHADAERINRGLWNLYQELIGPSAKVKQ